MVEDYEKRHIIVCFCKLHDTHKKAFLQSGLMQLIGVSNFFTKTKDALSFVQGKMEHSSYSTYAMDS